MCSSRKEIKSGRQICRFFIDGFIDGLSVGKLNMYYQRIYRHIFPLINLICIFLWIYRRTFPLVNLICITDRFFSSINLVCIIDRFIDEKFRREGRHLYEVEGVERLRQHQQRLRRW